jgi:hypothetical protein
MTTVRQVLAFPCTAPQSGWFVWSLQAGSDGVLAALVPAVLAFALWVMAEARGRRFAAWRGCDGGFGASGDRFIPRVGRCAADFLGNQSPTLDMSLQPRGCRAARQGPGSSMRRRRGASHVIKKVGSRRNPAHAFADHKVAARKRLTNQDPRSRRSSKYGRRVCRSISILVRAEAPVVPRC